MQEDAERGAPWPPVTADDYRRAGMDWHVFPNTILLPMANNCLCYRVRPNGDDVDPLRAGEERQRVPDRTARLAGVLPGDDDAPSIEPFEPRRHRQDRAAGLHEHDPGRDPERARIPVGRPLPPDQDEVGAARLLGEERRGRAEARVPGSRGDPAGLPLEQRLGAGQVLAGALLLARIEVVGEKQRLAHRHRDRHRAGRDAGEPCPEAGGEAGRELDAIRRGRAEIDRDHEGGERHDDLRRDDAPGLPGPRPVSRRARARTLIQRKASAGVARPPMASFAMRTSPSRIATRLGRREHF